MWSGAPWRDAMLSRPTHDSGHRSARNAILIARKVADSLNGFFYPLDADRDYGRVNPISYEFRTFVIDFTVYQGPNLESDLRARDFTVNSMAVEIHQTQALLDPLVAPMIYAISRSDLSK